eukprot:3554545-Rhodomonas_salina.1
MVHAPGKLARSDVLVRVLRVEPIVTRGAPVEEVAEAIVRLPVCARKRASEHYARSRANGGKASVAGDKGNYRSARRNGRRIHRCTHRDHRGRARKDGIPVVVVVESPAAILRARGFWPVCSIIVRFLIADQIARPISAVTEHVVVPEPIARDEAELPHLGRALVGACRRLQASRALCLCASIHDLIR